MKLHEIGWWCLLIIFFSTAPLNAQWNRHSTGYERDLTDVTMASPEIAYAGGIDGIFKSTDGGLNWQLLPYFQSTLETIDSMYYIMMNEHHLHFTDENVGFSAGWSAWENKEMIIKTVDGGQHWKIVHYGFFHGETISRALTDLEFVSATTGITVGYKGRILKTTDAGESWRVMESGTTRDLECLQFIDEQRGFAAGKGVFLTTQNGGASWQQHYLEHTIRDIYFFDEKLGYAITAIGRILKTTDGGQHWSSHYYRQDVPLWKITFTDAVTGFIAGGYEQGILLKTEDGGNNWFHDMQPEDEGLLGIYFLDPERGMVSSTQGGVYSTRTAGTVNFPTPEITSFSPEEGSAGTRVTITGSNLGSVYAVLFNDKAAEFTYGNDHTIIATVPAGTASGKIKLRYKGGELSSSRDFKIVQKPVVLEYPAFHPKGEKMIFRGEYLDLVEEVNFYNYGRQVNVEMDFVLLDGNSMEILIPAGFAASFAYPLHVNLKTTSETIYVGEILLVERPYIAGFGANQFSFENTHKAAYRGTELLIRGQDLALVEEVLFNENPVEFSVLGNEQIKVVTPAEPSKGYIELRGKSGNGRSVYPFKVLGPPEVKALEKDTVVAGEWVLLHGRHLTTYGTAYLYVGGRAVKYEEIDENTLRFLVPPYQEGKLDVHVYWRKYNVKTDTLQLFVADIPPPEITYLSPSTGGMENTEVHVEGSFSTAEVDSVQLGNAVVRKADFSSAAVLTSFRFKVPEGASSAPLKVYTSRGIATAADTFYIQELPPPFVGKLEPPIATAGSRVLLRGEYLQEIDSILLGDKSLGFTVKDSRNAYLFLSEEVTTGRLELYGKNGYSKTQFDLVIEEKKALPPEIYSIIYPGTFSSGDHATIIGNNLSSVNKIWLDDVELNNYRILEDDTIQLTIPYLEQKSRDAYVVLSNPAGSAYYQVAYRYELPRAIKRVSKYEGVRSEPIDIILEPKEPYEAYMDVENIYFNGLPTDALIKVNDDHYIATVPEYGDVQGPITISFGNILDQSVVAPKEFVLAEGYCYAAHTEYYTVGSGGTPKDEPLISIDYFQLGNKQFSSEKDCSFYTDNTNQPIEVQPGQSYPLVFRLSSCKENPPQLPRAPVRIYIDYNGNGDFYDEGELALSFPELYGGNEVRMLLKIPDNVPTGSSGRLRILSSYYAYGPHNINPCGFTNSSEVEDYSLKFVAPAADAEISSFFPEEGNAGTKILINGAGMEGVRQVHIGGAATEFFYIHTNTIVADVPPEAGSGPIELIQDNGRISTATSFKLNASLEPSIRHSNWSSAITTFTNTNPADSIFAVFMGQQDVPYLRRSNLEPGTIEALFTDYTLNGLLCAYNKAGGACSNEEVEVRPVLENMLPYDAAYNGEEVRIRGRYFNGITSVTFNGVEADSFRVINNNEIVVVVPEGATTGPVSVSGVNGAAANSLHYRIDKGYCHDDLPASEYDFITYFRLGNFVYRNNSRPLKNYTASHEEIVVVPGYSYAYELKTQSGYFKNVGIAIDRNHDYDFRDFGESFPGNKKDDMLHIPRGLKPGTYTMRVLAYTYLQPFACEISDKGEMHDYTLRVIDPYNPPAPASAALLFDVQDIACVNEPVLFAVQNTESWKEHEFSWDFGDGGSSAENQPVYQYTTPGIYTLRLSVRKPGGEATSISKHLIITEKPAQPVISSSEDPLCPGNKKTLSGPAGFAEYEWSTGAQTREISVEREGDYQLRVRGEESCWSDFSETVTLSYPSIPIPVIEFVEDKYLIASPRGAAYKWYKDGHILDEQEQAMNYQGAGEYQVEVLYENGCSGLSEAYFFEALAIDGREAVKAISVYPNPASDRLEVHSGNNKIIKEIAIYNLQMHRIKNVQVNADFLELDVKELAPGAYLLQIVSDSDQVIVRKFIII